MHLFRHDLTEYKQDKIPSLDFKENLAHTCIIIKETIW